MASAEEFASRSISPVQVGPRLELLEEGESVPPPQATVIEVDVPLAATG